MAEASSIWRNARLLLLLTAQVASNVGDWLFTLALFVLIGIRWHGSPIDVSVALVCNLVPSIVLSPVAGAVADRANRKALMVLSNILSALLLLAIVSAGSIAEIDGLLMFLGVAEAFFSPSELSLLKEFVPDGQMQQAMAARTVVSQVTKLLGPALSGVLVAFFGTRVPFYVDATSFAVASAFVLMLPSDSVRARAKGAPRESGSLLASSLSGLREIGRVVVLRRLTLLYVALLLGINLVDAQFVVLLRGTAHAAEVLGLVMSLSGAGMAGAAALSMRRRRVLVRTQISVGAIVMGVSIAAEALLVWQHATALVPVAALVLGAGAAVSFITLQTALQRRVPPEWTGRVMGSVRSLGGIAAVGGPLLGGLLANGFGVGTTFLLAGGLLAAIGVTSLLVRYWPEEVVGRAEGAADA